jgi:hypothetical protein
MEPLGVGQGGPHQVDGPAQVRVGLRPEAVGPCEAPVELVHGRSKRGHDPEGAVHTELVRAVAAAPGARRSANIGGEPRAVGFHPHGVAAESGAERPVTRCDDGMPFKRRRLVVLGPVAFGIESMQVGVLHLLPGILGYCHTGAVAGEGFARGFHVAQVVEVGCAVIGTEHHVPAVHAAVPRGDQGHRRMTSRQFLGGGRRPSVAMAAGHYKHMRPRGSPGPVSQHEGVAVKDQVHQGSTVRRRNRS